MKDTERTKRINKAIDNRYKSNKGCWWVSNSSISNMVILHKGGINHKINHVNICKLIFANEKSVDIIHVDNACMTYTRKDFAKK